MAKRSCGMISIDIAWIDSRDAYRVRLSHSAHRVTMFVNAPRYLTRAVDDPVAYDEAASAALSFALDEGHTWITDHAWTNAVGNGWLISRNR